METDAIFKELKSYLNCYENNLDVIHDTDIHYYLNTKTTESIKKPEFFGAVQIKKSYVSYHLMPIYCFPELLQGISAELKKRMQGKSCFNFSKKDAALFNELKILTRDCFQKYKSLQKIS